jgi:hypothetical protein
MGADHLCRVFSVTLVYTYVTLSPDRVSGYYSTYLVDDELVTPTSCLIMNLLSTFTYYYHTYIHTFNYHYSYALFFCLQGKRPKNIKKKTGEVWCVCRVKP